MDEVNTGEQWILLARDRDFKLFISVYVSHVPAVMLGKQRSVCVEAGLGLFVYMVARMVLLIDHYWFFKGNSYLCLVFVGVAFAFKLEENQSISGGTSKPMRLLFK